MTLTETKSAKAVASSVERLVEKKYPVEFLVGGKKCFKHGEEHYFMITGLEWEEPAVVVEHADTLSDAKKNFFEDGDLFYIDEMSEDEIFDAIVNEVEAA